MKNLGSQTRSPKIEKLIDQNTKLNSQVRFLQDKMSNIIMDNVKRQIQEKNNKNNHQSKMEQIVVQENYIRKLKAKLHHLGALNIHKNAKGVRKQENQLTLLKRQYQELINQRETLSKVCRHKQTHLQYNQPLEEVKVETIQSLAKLRKRNIDLQGQIVELQRQVRKYHKYQQLHKTFKDQPITIHNQEYELKKMEHEQQTCEKKTKTIEAKWKPQMEALDHEYFSKKQTLLKRQKSYSQLQNQLKIWQARSSASRNQSAVILDRQRLSKVRVASPAKKLPSKQKMRNVKKQTGITSLLRQLKQTLKQNIQQAQQIKKWSNEPKYESKSDIVGKHSNPDYNQTRLSEKNEFILSKNAQSGFEISPRQPPEKKKKTMTNNAAVGTSFYFDEDED